MKKHLPEMPPIVSITPSPIAFTDQIAVEHYRDAIKVFIGHHVAKRREAQGDLNINNVMTFEVLGALLAT